MPFVETNVTGTVVLLQASRRFLYDRSRSERDAFRFLHVSTDEVYGTLGRTGYFTEETPYSPNSPYAASKAAADHLVRSFHSTHQLATLITNCSNNYGPFQHPEKLIPLMILNALQARALPIYGDGGNVGTGCTSRITAPRFSWSYGVAVPAKATTSARRTSNRTSSWSNSCVKFSRRCIQHDPTRR